MSHNFFAASSAGDEISPKVALTPYSMYSFSTGASMVSSGSNASFTSPAASGVGASQSTRARTCSPSGNSNQGQTTGSVFAASAAVAPLTPGGPSTYTGQKPSATRFVQNYHPNWYDEGSVLPNLLKKFLK